MKRWIFTCVCVLLSSTVHAQLANPTAGDFNSVDHTTVIPAGQVNAGQPTISAYQASLFSASADVANGVPLAVGPVVPKATAVAQAGTNPVKYRLTFTQMGITIPSCSSIPCPQYTLLLVAIGPGGTSAKGVASESDSFTAAVPTPAPVPAGPTNIKVVP